MCLQIQGRLAQLEAAKQGLAYQSTKVSTQLEDLSTSTFDIDVEPALVVRLAHLAALCFHAITPVLTRLRGPGARGDVHVLNIRPTVHHSLSCFDECLLDTR